MVALCLSFLGAQGQISFTLGMTRDAPRKPTNCCFIMYLCVLLETGGENYGISVNSPVFLVTERYQPLH